MNIKTDSAFESKLDNYPDNIRDKMRYLRSLIRETAQEMEISSLEETLKWGEPSFLTKHGSTLRMDWKAKTPDQYALYFKCTSRLVETFKVVHSHTFKYEGKRAIVFGIEQLIPVSEVKQCIEATLQYHQVKEDVKLGM